ncbi:uncharacterized protein LOC123512830 [Portunus trituberculatus]|uniref:uncharacterized protein LOC123512830 n=1 Tax=Portunus trituberculatus TaxID=210409 RepID=UPI001E1D08DE|nr:uncharacterized protein LOC123512830 [Portunus trituberculatus]
MLFRVLPRTFDLWGVRSPATLPFSTVTRKATHYLLWFKRCPKPQSGLRCLSSGHTLGCRDPGDYASDPQVKEWLKELHKDFSHQPQQEILSSSKAKEGKEKTKEEGLASDMAEKEKRQEERKEGGSNPVKVWSRLVAEKYQKLDTHTQIIYDYDEEQQRREAGLEMEEEVQGKQEKVKLMRGETGVFDVEELVDLLREDNGQDIVAIQIPDEMKYASYMVIVSSASQRHTTALSELVKAAYKLKKSKKDPSVLMEGKGTDWVAMDMGNIILHIMRPKTREIYDLETLWTVGAEFDERSQVTEEDLVGVHKPRDPLAPPPPAGTSAEAVT